jgi:hypothetical protein
MMVLVSGIIGIALYIGFLGFMLWWVPALPLILIVALCTGLLAFDFIQTVRFGEDRSGRR